MKRFFLLLTVLCLLACVPTPETEAVIVKTDSHKPQEAAQSLADSSDVCRTTYDEGGVTVRFDAVPEIPKTEHIASYALHAAGFSDEQLAAFVRAFFGDGPVYEPGEPTKEEIYPELLAALELLEQVKANPGTYEAGADAYRADAEKLQRAYNAAPDTDELIPKAVAFARNENSGAFGCRGDGGRDAMATLTVFSEGKEDQSLMRYRNPSRYVPESYAKSVSPGLTLNAPNVDQDEAIRIASDLAKALCGDALRYAGCERGARVSDATGWYEQDPDETPLLVFFTRVVDGMQVGFSAQPSASGTEDQNFADALPYERLIVGVDSKGVCFAEWQAPVTVGEPLCENCAILSADAACERAASYLRFLYPASGAIDASNSEGQAASLDALNRGSVRSSEIEITRIALGWMQVRTGANALESKLIPVWDFCGTVTRTYENGESVTTGGKSVCLLTLDAETGARIDRALGY
jgi:hypothetical protein